MVFMAAAVCLFIWRPLNKNEEQESFSKKLSVTFSIFIFLLAFGLYFHLGGYFQLQERYSFDAIDQALMHLHQEKHLSKEKVVNTLLAVQKRLPASAQAWGRLADVYQALNLYENASHSYRMALKYNPEHSPFQTQLTYCEVMLNDGKVSKTHVEQLEEILKHSPTDKGALNLLALYAFQREEFQNAIRIWDQILLNSENVSDNEKQAIKQAIRQAKENLGIASSFSIDIELNIPEQVEKALSESAVLFVIAKDPLKGSMPIAVKKLAVRPFPNQVNLSDDDVMMAGNTLQSMEKVNLIARISKSGDPMPKSGDFQGEANEVTLAGNQNKAVILINKQLD